MEHNINLFKMFFEKIKSEVMGIKDSYDYRRA